MTQRQEFDVLEKHAGYEIRRYKPCVVAEVRQSAPYSIAANLAFNSLFKFISKGNNASQKIAMTAPVIAAQRSAKSDSDEWVISFVMPAGSSIDHLPHPNDLDVVLREISAQTCIALSFRGKATAEKSQIKVRELRQIAAKEKIELSDETRICRFNPPFIPGFLQYNEIVIPLI
jgi:hypothetical protein